MSLSRLKRFVNFFQKKNTRSRVDYPRPAHADVVGFTRFFLT